MTQPATAPVRPPQGPPKDVEASELWCALTAIPVPHEIVDFPVKDPVMGKPIGQVAIVPLAPEDLWACRKLAYNYTSDLFDKERPAAGKESEAFASTYGDESAVQILWRALRDPANIAKKAIPAPILMRRAPFTGDIIALLLKQYLTTCAKLGPVIATMTDAEKDAWLDALEEGGAAFPFEWLSSGMQSELLMHSAARSRRLRTANTSPGSPQGESSPDISKQSPTSDAPPQTPPSDSPQDLVADELTLPKD